MLGLRSLFAVLALALPATVDPGPPGVCCAEQQTPGPDGLGQKAEPQALVSGALVIVGGALDPDNEAIYRAILDRRLPARPICVLPTASDRPRRSMASYVNDFRRYGGPGAANGVAITHEKPQRAADPKTVARLQGCGGIFFTGGDQSRIVDVLRPGGEPSPADAAIRRIWARGGVVAGTSAGAAMMSDPMIGGGSSSEAFTRGVTPKEDALGVWVRDGMGFLAPALIDQHCLARGRLGRLLVAAAEDGMRRFAVCIDENTALVVEAHEARVVGASGVAVLDLEPASRSEGGRGFRDGRLWLLGDGDQIDLESGHAIPGGGKRPWVPELLETITPPTDPWVQDAFHRFVISFSGSAVDSATLGDGPASVRLRKGEDFNAYQRAGDQPAQSPDKLFAGPIEIDWLPEETAGYRGERCHLIEHSRRQPMNPEDYAPVGPGLERWLIEAFDGTLYNQLLGVQVEEVRRDYGRLRLPFKPELLHPGGVVHGGAIASLIDAAAALAIFSRLTEPPRSSATIDLHVHYLEAVVDEDLIAEAAIRRRGRSIVFVTVEVTTASGTVVAHGELSFRVITAS